MPIKVKYYKDRKAKNSGSLIGYFLRAITIILRTFRDYKPLVFFGIPGAAVLGTGILFLLYSFVFWIIHHQITPIRMYFFVGVVLFIFGLLLIILALIADMLKQIRQNQEEILYKLKKKEYEKSDIQFGIVAMIHIILGTKAQLIKVAPVMIELKKRGIYYNFIFTGQHKETIKELIEVLRLKKPNYIFYEGKDITKISQMFVWSIRCLIHAFKNKKEIFQNQKGIVLVHGDAFSALLGAIMGKIAGLKVGYIEGGLRSFNFFHPFPEEFTRRITSKLTDYHFCPGKFAYDNSKKYKGVKINTEANTLYDSLQLVIKNKNNIQVDIPQEKYCLVSIHRFENIFNKKQLLFIINTLEEISQQIKVLFIFHKLTKEKLENFGFFQKLKENQNIELRPRYDYFQFIKLLLNTEFIITDGGSNQEESYYLGKPCLVMRKTTERQEGLGKNVVISKYDIKIIKDFVNNYQKYKLGLSNHNVSPSKIIVDYLDGLEK